MQAAIKPDLIQFNDWTLRVRASAALRPRLLLLIHGWTGDENSMWVFTRALSSDYWMIAPRGRYTAEPSGFSWRPNDPSRHSLEQLQPAVHALIQLVDDYAASAGLDAAQFDLMGFSQGAAMVNMLGMLYPRRVRKMGVLAGFIPAGMEDIVAAKPLAGKHIFVAHGTQDPLVPVERARSSVGLLEQAGAQVTYCEAEVGHKLSANCLRALEAYLND